jgi:hypothetical protein
MGKIFPEGEFFRQKLPQTGSEKETVMEEYYS